MSPERVLAALVGADVLRVNPDGTYSPSPRLIPTKSICERCAGNGYLWRDTQYAYHKCQVCRGRGEVSTTAAVPKFTRHEAMDMATKIAERLT